MVIDTVKNYLGLGEKEPWEKVNRRVKTPTVLQMEAVECGAASLAMVMGYHGRHEPLEDLRVECGVSRDGSKASNILQAARSYGFEAKGFKKQPEDLLDMEFPVILFWNFNHFVVLEGFKNGKVYINDPASGPKVISWDEFKSSFTGVVLTFEPTDEFEPGGSRDNMLGSLLKRLSNSKEALTYVTLAGLFLVIPGLVIPIFSKIFVDKYLVAGMQSWITPLLVGMGVTALLHMGLQWLQQRFLLRMRTKLAISESSRFVWHILRLPVEFFSQRYPGDIASRVNLNDKVASMISDRLVTTVVKCFTIVFYAGLMFYYDATLTVVAIIMVLFNALALKYIQRKKEDASRRLKKEIGKQKGAAMNGLRSIETLKATGGEDDFFSKWAGHNAKVVNYRQDLASKTRVLNVIPSTLKSVTIALILGIGGLRVMEGYMTMGMLVAFQSLSTSFLGPVQHLVTMGSALQDLKGDMDRLDDVYNYEVDPVFDKNGSKSKQDLTGEQVTVESADDDLGETVKLSGKVEINQLDFGYNPLEEPLIDDFNLTLEPGKRVALVGPSGSGKSTLAKVTMGLFQPWDGEILFDGNPREAYPREVINNSISYVDQEISLFEGTIRDNLTLWDSTIPEEKVVQAAKDAEIHDVIAERPDGYESQIKEGGANFSGGQRQRLEIARALVQDPTFIVLDEATSALDPTTEEKVDDHIRRRGCSCMIVAHRLSTIRDCDEIIVLDEGTISERGTHDELLEQSDIYSDLIKSEGSPDESS